MVRVRIAPSPTGIPHIGNTRTALFNYLFAKHNKGTFLLRVEDTDRARLVEGAEKAILEILEWLGIAWDGEIERQSDRLAIYKEHSVKLIDSGKAYEDQGAIRFKMPKEGKTEWDDVIGTKHIEFENNIQEDFVMLKSDGYPTYNFANVIDDHLMEISHVIRGEEFISSTPKHIQLYKAFGWEQPCFAHLPVILGNDKTKLSKRHGAKSALDYRDEGYLKEALLNYMVLLGWNPGEDREIMTLLEMVELFDLKDVNTASPIFDEKKLLWMNGEYIRQSSIDELSEKLKDQSEKFEDKKMFEKFIELAQTRMKTLNEFEQLVKPFVEKIMPRISEDEKHVQVQLYKSLSQVSDWSKEKILDAIKKVLSQTNSKMKTIYKIITGSESGLPLADALELIGKEKTLQLLN